MTSATPLKDHLLDAARNTSTEKLLELLAEVTDLGVPHVTLGADVMDAIRAALIERDTAPRRRTA